MIARRRSEAMVKLKMLKIWPFIRIIYPRNEMTVHTAEKDEIKLFVQN